MPDFLRGTSPSLALLLLGGCLKELPIVSDSGPSECLWYADADADGFGRQDEGVNAPCGDTLQGHSSNSLDCDDSVADVHPDGQEVCDGIDNDCDGLIDGDDDDVDESTAQSYYFDSDADGVGGDEVLQTCSPPDQDGWVATTGDCNDDSADVFPGQTEWFVDERASEGWDYNCDGEEQLQFPEVGECVKVDLVCTHFPGFAEVVLSCGEADVLVVGCEGECEAVMEEDRFQGCH